VRVLVLLGVLVFIVAVVATVVAISGKRSFARAGEVVPGVATRAPASWAGAHSPEAKLHRRLRDAVAAGRANAALDRVGLTEARAAIEGQAVVVDDGLVVVAALPVSMRGKALVDVESAVQAVETAVGTLGATSARVALTGVDGVLAEVRERVALLAAARAELEAEAEGRNLP